MWLNLNTSSSVRDSSSAALSSVAVWGAENGGVGYGGMGNGEWGTHLGLHLLYVLVKQLVSNLLNGDCVEEIRKNGGKI